MQIKTKSTRVVALLTGGILAAATLFQPALAQAAGKSKTLKAGAVGLGVLGAYLLTKGKTVGGVAALAGGAYAYEKGRNNQKDNETYHRPEYRSYDGRNGNGPRYDSHAEYRDNRDQGNRDYGNHAYGNHDRDNRDYGDRDRDNRDRDNRDRGNHNWDNRNNDHRNPGSRDRNDPGCRDDQQGGRYDERDNRYGPRDSRYDNRGNGRDDRRDNNGGGYDLSRYLH